MQFQRLHMLEKTEVDTKNAESAQAGPVKIAAQAGQNGSSQGGK